MRTRITNIILTPGVDREREIPFIPDACVLVEGNRIVYAGKRQEAPDFQEDTLIDGQGNLAMPGLINMHTHTAMTLMRSIGKDLDVNRWLRKAIWPVESRLTAETVRAGSDLGCMEMIRYGTTCFHDMYMRMGSLAESVQNCGMRATLDYGIVDFDGSCRDLQPGIDLLEQWQNGADGRIRIDLGPHSEPTTTDILLLKLRQIAEEYHVPVHIHVSEARQDIRDCMERHQGRTPLAYLDDLGLTDVPLIAAHCVWLSEEEIELAARKQVTIVHCPVSNLKLASGIAPLAKMLAAGCRVTLGTDGVASNNNLNLWEEIKLAPLLAKGSTLDATVVSPAQVLRAATKAGAEALGYEDLGLLKAGYLADLILVDMHTLNCIPNNDPESELIYSVLGSDVQMTMVDGSLLYHRGKFLTLNEEAVLNRAIRMKEILLAVGESIHQPVGKPQE